MTRIRNVIQSVLRRPLLFVLALTVAVRVAALLVFPDVFAFDQTGTIHGSSSFDLLAQNLLATGTFGLTPGVPDAALSPLYPTVLAGVYGILGRGYLQVGLLHIALDLVTISCLYGLGRRLFGARGRLIGLLAGLFTACYPYLVFQNLTLIDTPLFMALMYAWLLLLVVIRGRPRFDRFTLLLALLAGVLLGLATLVRAVLPLMAVLAGVWFLFRLSLRQTLLRLLPVAAMTLLVLAPWMARNYRVFGQFVAISTVFGTNLYQGNNPEVIPFLRAGYDVQWTGDPIEGLPPTSAEADRARAERGLAYLRENPGDIPELLWLKFRSHWSIDIFPTRNPTSAGGDGIDITMLPGDDPVNAYSGSLFDQAGRPIHIVYFGGLLLLAIVGVGVTRRRWRETTLIIFLQISLTVFYVIFHSSTRYRVPSDPALFLFSAAALVWIIERLRPRDIGAGKTV